MRQIRVLLLSLVATFVAISLTGCAALQPEVRPMQAKAPETVTLKFNYPEVDPISGKKIEPRNNFSGQIRAATGYEGFHKVSSIGYKGLAVSIFVGRLENSNRWDSYYRLIYRDGNDYGNGSSDWTDVIFNIAFQVKSPNEIVFTFPKEYDYKPSRDALGMEIKPLDSFDNLEASVVKAFQAIEKFEGTPVSNKYILTGEVNTKYPDISVYANYKRTLGQYTGKYSWLQTSEKTSTVKQENTFNLKFQSKDLPLAIEVYPYREGSKVKYTTEIPYQIKSSGECTLTHKEIDDLRKQIEKIAND